MKKLFVLMLFACVAAMGQDKKILQDDKNVSVEAYYPGGLREFNKFIMSNLRMPEPNFVNDTVIKVYVSFVVDLDGCLTNIKVPKDPGYGLAEEAIRVIGLSKQWEPGSYKGRPVRTPYTLPLYFNFTGTGPVTPKEKKE